ncbi:MAG: lipoyl(octanoyl) transferase LipB [Mariprofundales bacterium]
MKKSPHPPFPKGEKNASSLIIVRHHRQPYPESMQEQEQRVSDILANHASPTLILTEHPPTYTIGTSGSEGDILRREIDGEPIAVFATGRGGEVTYHGPGQLICYLLADLRHARDLHRHIWRLEEMVIRTLADIGITAVRNPRGIGVWVNSLKIAAAGVRCRKWVTWHGIALNHQTNLKHFQGIIPCGMHDAPVTSIQRCGINITRNELESHIIHHAQALFSPSPLPIEGEG